MIAEKIRPSVVGSGCEDFSFPFHLLGGGLTPAVTGYIIRSSLPAIAAVNANVNSAWNSTATPLDGTGLIQWDQKLTLATGLLDISASYVPGNTTILPGYPATIAGAYAAHGQMSPVHPLYPNYLYVQIDIQENGTPLPASFSYMLFVKADISDVRGVYFQASGSATGYFLVDNVSILVDGY